MNVFDLRDRLIGDYGKYVRSFIQIQDERIRDHVEKELAGGLLWPDPLLQLNPAFESGGSIDDLVQSGALHPECSRIFRKGKDDPATGGAGTPLQLHRHQTEAIKAARSGANYVLTTGTGSGKSLTYIVPIVDHVLRQGSARGIQAIVVYPMNALANSQAGELKKFIDLGYPDGKGPVRFARYTGQESDEDKDQIISRPPDILLTNYVMLELLLTRPRENPLVRSARGLRFLVLDELHTYRGRQGADVAMLVRRTREAFQANNLQCVGTSATLAGAGTLEEQRAEVARVATLLFGTPVKPEHIVGETLRRATEKSELKEPAFVSELRKRIEGGSPVPENYDAFLKDPLSVWIEATFGLQEDKITGRLIRATPRSITGDSGAARDLAELTGLTEDVCAKAIAGHLLASYRCERDPRTAFPVFAFRLHQFISRGDTVYTSLEEEASRYLTVHGQQFVPGDRTRVLLPLVFCRECGQEYYCVRLKEAEGTKQVEPRLLADREAEGGWQAGFLHVSSKNPWPSDPGEINERLPDDWLEEATGGTRVKRDRRLYLPAALQIDPAGVESPNGIACHFIPAPFQFCLNCGITYSARNRSDFGKLAALGTEGRSTATTILSLASIRYLRTQSDLKEYARKLLSFTDNRQDASLQAGHFNDFVEIGLLRSALYKAAATAGPEGLRHEFLVQRVFDALSLPTNLYASDPTVRFAALDETKRALREVLGYRLYRDLERGWRITSPNLEQCGLLSIRYLSLDDLCRAEDVWNGFHPALATAEPKTREEIAKTLLDFMRRELAIKVNYLQAETQERIQQLSSQRLIAPWAIDDNEAMERSCVLYPRAKLPNESSWDIYLSPRGGFGQYLKRPQTFPKHRHRMGTDDCQVVIRQLFSALKQAGLVEEVVEARSKEDVPGYQLPASAMIWTAGDGARATHDPIRVPPPPMGGGRTNKFFIDFYKTIAGEGAGLEAREHTAQVDSDTRQEREQRFREGRLPILYCSPTMELGVDIAELNVVNMRNIPPTPANYAQRSGRAGRSGQPALVFSYCSTYRSHDQYFFRRPDRMVSGKVTPPRLDLGNQDLIRAHVQAIWLAETGQDLHKSLKDILDVTGDNPTLALQGGVRMGMENKNALARAGERSRRILETIRSELEGMDWYSPGWIDEVLSQIVCRFDEACTRWRGLYKAARHQSNLQHKIIIDASRSPEEKEKAKRLRAEAEAQMALLTEAQNAIEADFYSYRYFASEGFLPGYSFPRLPLSAFIPGRRGKKERNEFLSRPRFLAISEFGPRAIVYHEGARYRINKVIIPVQDEGEEVITRRLKQCGGCGYLHPIHQGDGPDLCERCSRPLAGPLNSLFRLQNVSTKRADRINSDEEERLRLGYEIRTGIRFSDHGGVPTKIARILSEGKEVARLTYGHTATLWRMNLGWTRRADKNLLGFVLDMERGYWQRNDRDTEDTDDPMSAQIRRVIPYVEDRRNSLLFEPAAGLDDRTMASLQAALKNAIQVEYQLEEAELAAEPLPTQDLRRMILFYEAAEGGAGVLRRLLEDPEALSKVARRALRICHFDPKSGVDERRAPRAKEDCEAACYDCLMSYGNQWDHKILDRQRIKDHLLELAKAQVELSPGPKPRAEHFEELLRRCDSELERRWLRRVNELNLRLPDRAQAYIEDCGTRPDFLYKESQVAIYIDGPFHDFPERKERDKTQTTSMEDYGYTVIRFAEPDTWDPVIRHHPATFGPFPSKE